MGVFILLALSTFSTKDIGWNSQIFTSSSSNEYQVTNAVGNWGAYVSDFLLTFLGYMSYIVVYWLLWPLVRHFFNVRNKKQYKPWILPVAAMGMILLIFYT